MRLRYLVGGTHNKQALQVGTYSRGAKDNGGNFFGGILGAGATSSATLYRSFFPTFITRYAYVGSQGEGVLAAVLTCAGCCKHHLHLRFGNVRRSSVLTVATRQRQLMCCVATMCALDDISPLLMLLHNLHPPPSIVLCATQRLQVVA